MSTLSLADLGPNMRRELGLEALCKCAEGVAWVAVIPIIETVSRQQPGPVNRELPGAAWLKTGLHRHAPSKRGYTEQRNRHDPKIYALDG